MLSPKGFDSTFDRYPSPILPDGRIVHLGIRSKFDLGSFEGIFCWKRGYYELMKEGIGS
jgi:hypothetical protein